MNQSNHKNQGSDNLSNMSEWKEYKLGEIAELRRELFTPNEKNCFPYIGLEHIEVKNLRLNGIGTSNDVSSQKSIFYPTDILYGKLRPYFQKVYSPNFKGVCSTDIFVIKPKKNLHPKFLFYLIASTKFTELANIGSTGTRMPRADWKHLSDTVWKLPPLPTQTAIAEILSSLDDKIELNNKINHELESLAQTLFKRWFIDFEFPCLPQNYRFSGHVNQASGAVKPDNFDAVMTYKRVRGMPVPDGKSWFVYILLCEDNSFYKGMTNDLYRRFYEHFMGIGADHTKIHRPLKVIHWEQFDSKEEAAKREQELKTGFGRTWISRQVEKAGGLEAVKCGLPAPKTQLRMAGEMVDSELGEIPKGWEVGTLDDILVVKGGTTPSTKEPELWGGDFHWTSPKDLSNLKFPLLLNTEKKITKEGLGKISSGLLPKGSLLLSSRAPIGYLAITEIETAINQGYIAINAKRGFSNLYILYWIKANMDLIIERANGSTFLEISKTNFKQIQCIISHNHILDEFVMQVEGLFEQLRINLLENQELTKLRDTLLPKLISGELEVKDIN